MRWIIEMMLLRFSVTLLDVMEVGGDGMTRGVDNLQDAGNGQLKDFTMILQEICAEGADYTKKSVESRLVFGGKLLSAKSFDTVIQIQTEYAKTAYADFVAQTTKMGELHSDLTKAAFRPAAQVIAAMQGTKS
jgi:Phasin protein